MARKLIEGDVEFTFGDSWIVEKYDDHAETRPVVGVVENRKAVDFVGIAEEIAFLIEVKDYRGHRIENKPKTNGALVTVIAQKVYDTITGLLLTHRRAPETQLWRDALGACRRPGGDIRVVVWLEDDALFRRTEPNRKSAAWIFTAKLKSALKWFPGKVLVVNRDFNSGGLPDVIVNNLAGAVGHHKIVAKGSKK